MSIIVNGKGLGIMVIITATIKGPVINDKYHCHCQGTGTQWWILLPLLRDWLSVMDITAIDKELVINDEYYCHC